MRRVTMYLRMHVIFLSHKPAQPHPARVIRELDTNGQETALQTKSIVAVNAKTTQGQGLDKHCN